MSEQPDRSTHLEHHLKARTIDNPQVTTTTIPADTLDQSRDSKTTKGQTKEAITSVNPEGSSSSVVQTSLPTRRSARISLSAPGRSSSDDPVTASGSASTPSTSGKRKARPGEEKQAISPQKSQAVVSQDLPADHKGKNRAPRSPTPPTTEPPVYKRPRTSTASEGRYSLRSQATGVSEATPIAGPSKSTASKAPRKGRKTTKEMSKRVNPKGKRGGPSTPTERSKKGDNSSRHLIGAPMDDDDDEQWMDEPENSRSRFMDHESHEDENMESSGNDDEDDDHSEDDMGHGGGGGMSELARHARESGLLDEATAAAIFGGSGGFLSFGGMVSGLSNRFKRLRNELRSRSIQKRLSALRECSELLLVSNEDTLGGAFSINQFGAEFIAILKGRPNIDDKADEEESHRPPNELDEDAQLAAVLAMSGGGLPAGYGDDDEMECQLVACRCLAHLLEALPGSGHTLVHLGAVPALCAKLNEIEYIELAEQTLSTMEKISAEVPSAIVKEGGLAALLNFLPFFSTNVQRTAVTAAANCCRNISSDNYARIRDVFPILRDVLTQADQRLAEQATLAVVRTIEAFRHIPEHLEGLLDVPTVVAVNSLLMPSGGSPLLSPATYTHLLRALTTSARGSAKVAIAFLEAGMTNTIYQILTGVLPPSHDEDEQGGAEGGQGLAGGVADMAVLQNLAHRPKDQVEESLALVCELLPPTPRDGVFDGKAYSEKSLGKIKKGRKSERSGPTRRSSRSSRVAEASNSTPGTSESTPVVGATALPGTNTSAEAARDSAMRNKREAEVQLEQRMDLFKAQPELLAKFIKAIVPVLVDVYAASVTQRVRTKVLSGLLKAIAFAEPEMLRATLRSVPMASFLCAIIASKDSPIFVMGALQLVELLAVKLPDVYQISFQREGVVFEIEALAAQDLSTAKDKGFEVKKEPEENAAGPSTIPNSESAPLPSFANVPDDLKPLLAASGFPTGLSAFLADTSAISSSPRRSGSIVDPNDANVLRARVLVAKKIFHSGEDDNSATAVLDEVAALVKRLCVPEASDGEIRDTLQDVTKQFTKSGQALSSFELLKSGLVDGILEYVDIEGVVPSSDRRAMLFDVFSDTSLATSTPLTLLVKRLHESLGRLEDFQVETAFNGSTDTSRSGSSGLSRTLRVRLQAEEGQNVPKQLSAISVTIQAIAPLQALHDYLRPRVADSNYQPGSGLSGMFAAMASASAASGMGMRGGATSRLLSALNAAQSAGTEASRAPASQNAPATSDATPRPTRRRSARLSGLGAAETGAEPGRDDQANATGEPGAGSSMVAEPLPEPSMFPSMDMDFDDDDGYSDEDYDAEVYEDEMEEELSRPQEKVVNMSVAPDGSRVEAKTPEGTRIATPSQAAQAQAGNVSMASGSDTPRTSSYAGAVKTAPTDFHLEFTYNGKIISLEDTIYGAVHKNQPVGSTGAIGSYGSAVVFKFRKVDGPAPSLGGALDAPSPASVVSTLPAAFDPTTPTSKILRLLRVLHNLSVDAVESKVDANLFVNNKLTAKLTRQLEEIMIIASNCLPDWAIELPKHFSFLFPFETRYSFLQSTSFGYGRLIAKSQSSQNNRGGRNRDDVSHLARIVRQKVRISRAQILESCAKVLELYGTSSGILEVEYFDEIGTGLGPTLEFYSIASREFARKSLKLWRDEDETKSGEYVYHPRGLYPAPIKADDESHLSWYKTLGLFAARALLDSRIIDVNMNKIFLKLILGRPVKKTISNLKLVDVTLARSLERLQTYLQTRKEIEVLKLPPGARRNKLMQLTVGGAKLGDLSLDFTLPGYNIELKPGGAHIDVDDHNLEEYLERVLDFTLGEGIKRQVKSFQEGFSMIFSVEDLKIFSPDELGLLFGNADEDWSKDTLEHIIKADHGYNLDSRSVQNLIEVMSNYSKDERRQFLQFITGAPKLPIGGFRGLNPPFTVVRKPHEAPFRADDYLPSVMTCAQYLKLPDYSTKEILATQLQRAMLDGGGSFHLS